ncbi:MAG: aldo/keto reductase [Ruminococcaceae bacterium]|nr:aldo/keto reductase [Oscillospiraceae bacterium]
MNRLTDTFKLNNGYEIPCVGFGTWQAPDGEVCTNSVIKAIECGYRHIDTAAVYGNEKSVGNAIKNCGVKREELFITSKVWNSERGYETTLAAFEKTMSDLSLDYLDLYLIHWPASAYRFKNWEEINLGTWKAMTELYDSGRIKAIGVSNFLPHHMEALMKTEVRPMVNQIEYHPGQLQEKTVEYCVNNKVTVEAWSPLGTGRMLTNEKLGAIAGRYNVSTAQLCIRFCLQNGILPLPKSVTPSRIEENARVFDFEISKEDMAQINAMEYFAGSGLDPDTEDF